MTEGTVCLRNYGDYSSQFWRGIFKTGTDAIRFQYKLLREIERERERERETERVCVISTC